MWNDVSYEKIYIVLLGKSTTEAVKICDLRRTNSNQEIDFHFSFLFSICVLHTYVCSLEVVFRVVSSHYISFTILISSGNERERERERENRCREHFYLSLALYLSHTPKQLLFFYLYKGTLADWLAVLCTVGLPNLILQPTKQPVSQAVGQI